MSPEVNSESPGHFPERLASTRLTLPGGRLLSANLAPIQAASTKFREGASPLIFLAEDTKHSAKRIGQLGVEVQTRNPNT